uniref:Uncharacterized protein n=1 Tax=Oryza glumipatula TaxID=40148 RepID=A0A0E0AJV2_9ORYZ
MARPSESGGHPSMFLAATSWHCAHPPSPTVSTHWDAASHGARGAAAASSPTSPRAASTNPPSATSAEPLHTCVFSGSVAGPSRQAALSYLTTQPSRMARPLLAAPHLARRRDAAAGVEARDAVRSRDVRAALRHGERRRVGEWLRRRTWRSRHHHRWMTGWRGARRSKRAYSPGAAVRGFLVPDRSGRRELYAQICGGGDKDLLVCVRRVGESVVAAPLRRVEARGRRGGEALLSLRGPPAADGGGALPLHVRPAVEGDQARPPRVRPAVEDAEGGGAPPLPLQLHVRPAVEGAVEDVEGGGALPLPLRVRPAVVEGGVGVGAEPQALVAGVGDAAQGGEAVVVAVADDKSAARESASIELGVVYQQMEAVWVKIEREVEERRKNREIAKKTRDWASAVDSTKRSEAKIDDLIKQYDSHSRRASELRLKMVNLQARPISPPPRPAASTPVSSFASQRRLATRSSSTSPVLPPSSFC